MKLLGLHLPSSRAKTIVYDRVQKELAWLLPGQPRNLTLTTIQSFPKLPIMTHRLRHRLIGRLPSIISGHSVHGIRRFAVGNSFPRIVGAGEAKSSTPIPPPPLAWYKHPQFIRNVVNILLLASFANSAAIILSYKSLERDITWKSKERIRKLKETIERVRNGESVDIRAALGTGDPEVESRWTEGIISWLVATY
jgi:hypothetical protein